MGGGVKTKSTISTFTVVVEVSMRVVTAVVVRILLLNTAIAVVRDLTVLSVEALYTVEVEVSVVTVAVIVPVL